MSTFHVSTYLKMGNDFDSRNRYLRQPADGNYEGYIVAGETWSFTWKNISGRNRPIALQFKMAGYVFTPNPNGIPPVTPTGISTGITSE
jgi:hypothetical protein